jgi:hypothetical protein
MKEENNSFMKLTGFWQAVKARRKPASTAGREEKVKAGSCPLRA